MSRWTMMDDRVRLVTRTRLASLCLAGTYGSWLGLSVLAGCSAPSEIPERTSTGKIWPRPEVGADGIIAASPLCAVDNPFCQPSNSTGAPTASGPAETTEPTDCGSVPIDLQPAGVNVMLAVDGAAGMAPHWGNIVTAIRSLRANNPTASFAIHSFWADPIDVWNFDQAFEQANTTNNACLEVHNEVLDLGDHSAEELIGFLGDGPRGGTIMDVYQVSPLIEPLNRYLKQLTKLVDPDRTNYLVIFTGGNDNCFGSAFMSQQDKLFAYKKLAAELSRLNVRVIPVGVDPPSDGPPQPFGILGFGPGLEGTDVANITTDYEALGALLAGGGTRLAEVPRVDTAEELAKLVSKVGQTVANCRFKIPAELDSTQSVSAFGIAFNINGTVVPRDRSQVNGWDFVNGSTDQVEFFGQGCEAIQSGLTIQAGKSCDTDVCGQAAVSVSTKPRVVLLLLDSSASRIECSDGSLGCVLSAPGTAGRPLSYWEVVQRAVSEALISPVNADVEFGIQFFPSKTAEALSCNVDSRPEITPAPRTKIDIMQAMLEKLPFGFSPVVQVLENVATEPGKLADPDVIGSVVLLSDGGDNCSGEMQAEIVSRLGAATKKLSDAGVRTFAVRYGSEAGRAAEQEDQLVAVAENGGTALMGKDVPYLDAKSPEELENALAGISDRLATCSFRLGNVDSEVDKDRTSLYMDGEQIAFDSMATKQAGWNWVGQERAGIELYGDACEAFKTSRKTNIVVEFGCEPEVVPPLL